MSPYSQRDYEANPNKYRLFKTARIAMDIPGSDIRKGDYVGITYLDARINRAQPGDPVMPIYEINGLKHYLYAYALSDFVL